MGFPPIGIMSLSAVLKRAGHECVMFDQANPDTPNDVIIEEIRRQQPGSGRPELPQHDELSVRQDPRRARSAPPTAPVQARVRRRVRHAQRPAGQAAVPRSGLRLPRRRRAAHPRSARASGRSAESVAGVTWAKDGKVVNNPEPTAGAQPRPVAVPRPREPAARFRRVDAARRAGRALAGALHHDADLARLPLAVRLLRHPDLQRRQVALAQRRSTSSTEFKHLAAHGYGSVYFVDDHFLLQPKRIEAICNGMNEQDITIQWGMRGTRRLRRAASLPGDGEGPLPHASCSASRAAARRSSTG